ncbi:MAG: hypothetical protein IT373_16015 [Polyangiaceae bacterium]|nr:hypothetical protein [Polyangiaceae bacterium]
MKRSFWCTVAALGFASSACAKGSGVGEAELASGLYELSTVGYEGTCPLEDSVTEGTEYVGKLVRVEVTASPGSVRLAPCDPFFDSSCFSSFAPELSLIREGESLYAREPHWTPPGCSCWEPFAGERGVDGFIVGDNAAELSWTFALPVAPPECFCESWSGCSATLEQRLLPY